MGDSEIFTLVDFLFAGGGTGLTIWLLYRKSSAYLPDEVSFPPSWGELIAMGFALLVSAIGPNTLVFALTPGMPEMHVLGKYLLFPSILILLLLTLTFAKLDIFPIFVNRVTMGVAMGAVATGTLDIVRLTGFYLGWLPGNMPRMFGVLLLDRMAEGPLLWSDILGYLYHLWVGACFGLTLALVIGRANWWQGLIWGLLIEVGMMTTPPMVIAMDTGFFGLKYKDGWQILATSVPAHIVFGIFLGMLLNRYVSHKGTIFRFIRMLWK